MFYFEEINGYKVLKSDILDGINHCFTTRKVKPNIFGEKIISNLQDPLEGFSPL